MSTCTTCGIITNDMKDRRRSARKLFCCKISTNIQSLTGQAPLHCAI
jgi:hypothetical protein